MTKPQSAPPRTLVQQVGDALIAAAARGELLPGDRLVEAEIARSLGVSRVPVREALRMLESSGAVVSSPYRGVRVMAVDERTVRELAAVRRVLQGEAMRAATEGLGIAARWVPVASAVEAGRHAVQRRDAEAMFAACRRFHAGIFRAAGRKLLLHMWEELELRAVIVWGFMIRSQDPFAMQPCHEAVLDAVLAGEHDRARALLLDHLGRRPAADVEAMLEEARRQRGEKPPLLPPLNQAAAA